MRNIGCPSTPAQIPKNKAWKVLLSFVKTHCPDVSCSWLFSSNNAINPINPDLKCTELTAVHINSQLVENNQQDKKASISKSRSNPKPNYMSQFDGLALYYSPISPESHNGTWGVIYL